jgi:phage-related protein
MAGNYHAGTATVDVLPSLKGFHKTIGNELRRINPDVSVNLVADTKRAQRQIASAVRPSTVKLRVETDTRALAKAEADVRTAEQRMRGARDASADAVARLDIAEKQLAETRARSGAKASQIASAELRLAQAKRAVAAATMDSFHAQTALDQANKNIKDAKAKLQTDVDTAGLGAKLQAFSLRAAKAYRIKLGVDPDLTGAEAKLATFRATAVKLATIHGKVELDTGAALAKLTLLGAKGAVIGTGIAGGAGAAAAGLLAIPGAITVVLGSIAALTAGISGVPAAFKAFSDAEDQAAQNATANAKSQQAAARQISSARQQVTQSQTQLARAYEDASVAQAGAARRVQDAERQVIAAERQRLQAQQDLTRAVEDARRAQQDLNFQVQGGALAERQAVLDLADAQKALEDARAAGTEGPELERVQLAYEQQLLSLQEIRARNANLAADKKASDAAGIRGSDQVVAAEQRVADATQGVADAQQGVRDAQADAAQVQVQAQRSIADAQLAVVQAQQQLSNALADAGTVGAASSDKINAAMAKLSPSAKAFVNDVRTLSPAFDDFKRTAQEALFQGLGPAFVQFGQVALPAMATNLGVVSGAVNGVTKDMLGFLSTQQSVSQFQGLFAGIGQIITASSPVLQTFVQLFLDLSTAAMPGLVALVQAVGTVGTALAAALQPLIQSGAITQAITLIAQLLASLAPIIAQVVVVAVQLWTAIGPTLISTVQALTPVINSLLGLFLQIAPVLAQVVLQIAQALLPVVQALAPLITALLPPITSLISSGLQVLVPLIQSGAELFLALMPAIQAVADVIAQLVPIVAPLLTQLITGLLPVVRALAPVISQLAAIFLQGLASALTQLIPYILQAVSALTPMIPTLASIITQIATGLLPIFAPLVDAFLQLVVAVLPLLPPLLQLAEALLPAIIALVGSLMPILNLLAQIFTSVLAAVINSVVLPALNALVGAVRIVSDTMKFLYDTVIKPIWSAIGAVIDAAWNGVIKPVFDAIGTATQRVGEFFQKMADTINGIWGAIKKIVHDGIQAVVDLVYNNGIRALANAVIKYIPGLDYLPELKIPEFAAGGVLPGYAPGQDTQLILASPGEAILVPELVRAIGPRTILAANAAAMRGRRFAGGGIVPAFATGGLVGASSPTPAAGAAVTIDPAALAGLGEIAAAVTGALNELAVMLTGIVDPAVRQVSAVVITIAMPALRGYMDQTIQLAAAAGAQWANITNSVNTSTAAQSVALQALQTALAATRAAIGYTADWAIGQFDRLRAAAADPIRWVLQFPFNAGLVAAWNYLDGQFALGKHLDPVGIGFAFGGRVFGPGSSTSDSIRARLSAGEFVVQQAIAKRIYPFLTALNSGQPEALQAAGYATGGIVANTGGQLSATLARGLKFAKAQDGKPYVWGAVGPDGYDCSGFMSAITNVLRGESNPYVRLGVAAGQPWPGFVPGMSTAFATGYSDTHTAGTLAGVNVESGGSPSLVRFGGAAAGADSSQFPRQASLPLVGGSFRPGGAGPDLAAIVGPAFADTYRMIGLVTTLYAGNQLAMAAGGIATRATDSVQGAAMSALAGLLTVTSSAGSPSVVAAVKSVAARYGWDTGAEWDALSWIIGRESGWNPNAANPSTSARGLFQKMTSVHGPLEPTVAGQAEWGLNYIRSRYGDPLGARSWWQSHGWYDDGGLAVGAGWMAKNVLEPERVLSPAQTRGFDTLVAAAATGRLPGTGGRAEGPGQFTGQLFLDSGEFLGLVRGEIDDAHDEIAGDLMKGLRG